MQKQTSKIALLVMDIQNGIVSRIGESKNVLVPIKNAAEAARQNNIPVIFVRVGFSEGYPEISPQNKSFAAISKFGGMTVPSEETQIHEAVHPTSPMNLL